MKDLLFRTASLAIFLITTYLLIFLLINPNWQNSNPTWNDNKSNEFYSTGLYSKLLIWIDNSSFVFQKDENLYIYHLDDRSYEQIFSPNKSARIQTAYFDSTYKSLYIATISLLNKKQKTIRLDYKMKLQNETEYPISEYIKFGPSSMCLSDINQITQPNQIATSISIYRLSEDYKMAQPNKKLQTNLTLIPKFCTEHTLILSTPSKLMPQLYVWDTNKNQPEKLDVPIPPYTKLDQIEISLTGKTIAIQTGDSTVIILNLSNKNLAQIQTSSNIWTLKHPFNILTLDYGNEYFEIKMSGVESTKKLDSIISQEHFLSIKPSPNYQNVALTSDYGELWIYEKVKP